MNIRARNLLMDAFGQGSTGPLCPIGVLLRAVRCPHLHLTDHDLTNPLLEEAHIRCKRTVLKRFTVTRAEWIQLLTEHYDLGYDLLTLAWTHDPTVAYRSGAWEHPEGIEAP